MKTRMECDWCCYGMNLGVLLVDLERKLAAMAFLRN